MKNIWRLSRRPSGVPARRHEGEEGSAQILVVISNLDDQERISFDLVDDSVFFVYPPRPVACQSVLERFRFSFAVEWISGYLFDEGINPYQDFLICLLPVKIVFPGLRRKNDFHSWSFLS